MFQLESERKRAYPRRSRRRHSASCPDSACWIAVGLGNRRRIIHLDNKFVCVILVRKENGRVNISIEILDVRFVITVDDEVKQHIAEESMVGGVEIFSRNLEILLDVA